MEDHTVKRTSTRKKQQSAEGLQYQEELVDKLLSSSQKRLTNQIDAVNILIDNQPSREALTNDSNLLEKLFNDFLEQVQRWRELHE